ncbi:hypothetical protein BGW36DRAFT_294313 [Talaromyces proteolyticus]|uniref:DUF2293 domain-containing protein n=1 Tax=Talaromyces proteolyticus TaxID=1131652 RepID=A0AAD4PXB7_9EURO|nr:uncharacterized protein BGW36DRAFT_294313 [Talaromyces proteolyticus]KAH8699162.1 hypothetical protein BGW36DRAFT_294313 [Talaromyces proteolyticus]
MPEGYVFVAKGDPYVTRNCKTQSKAQGSVVYMVYDSKGKEQLGIRVKQEVYSHITDLATQTAKDRAKAVLLRDARDQKKAQEVLKETFPKIPAHCAERILKHSFLKGSGRVGRTTTKSAEKKAQLAVEAHLRHEHTSYDSLLDDGAGREDARAAVRNVVQGMKDQWAGKSKIEVYLAGDCSRSRQRSSSSVANR